MRFTSTLTLTLLVLRVFTNHHYGALTLDYLALVTYFLYRWSDFHKKTSRRNITTHHLNRYVILPLDRSYGDNSTVTLSPGKILIKCMRIFPDT